MGLIRNLSSAGVYQDLKCYKSFFIFKFLKELLFSNTIGTPEKLLSLFDVYCQYNENSLQLLRIPNHKHNTLTYVIVIKTEEKLILNFFVGLQVSVFFAVDTSNV